MTKSRETADVLNNTTGLDDTFTTGTAGTGGNLGEWNADGDLVDTGLATSNLLLDSDLANNGGSVAQIATGTYTGDGTTSKSITGLGFKPKFVEIYRRETADGTGTQVYRATPEIVDDNADGAAHRLASSTNAIQSQIKTNGIISLDSDGFTVDDAGSDSDPNTNNAVYNYWAMG